MDRDTYICRCEDITIDDVKKVIEDGVTTIDEIKRLTRCGMGPCGGKTCSNLLMGVISRNEGIPIPEVKPSTMRPPAKNIKLGVIAKGGVEE